MNFEKGTYCLIKAMHHINCARQHFEDVKIGCKQHMKNVFNSHITKCDYIFNNVYDKLDDETRVLYKAEMSDSLGIESIMDKIVRLDQTHRDQLEDILENIVKGKKISVTIEDD